MIRDLLASLLGGALGGGFYERHRRSRLARDHAAGRPLELPGSVLGGTRYCHPAGGLLRVAGTSLVWLTGRGGMSFAVPVERLDVQDLVEVRPSEAFPGGRSVAVVCDDAGTTVRIVVLRADLPYLALAMPRLRERLAATGA
ncbi:MAG TPA: hypothetical protein VGK17_04515 [Propionicimonas sp.]